MISKAHISAHKPRRRQLNAKVCSSESAIFLILLQTMFRPQCSTTISRKRLKYSPSFYHETDAYHSVELCNHSVSSLLQIHPSQENCSQLCPVAVCCVGYHFLLLYACAHVVSVPNQRPQSLGLGARLVHTWNRELSRLARSLPVVVAKAHAVGRVLHLAAYYSYAKK